MGVGPITLYNNSASNNNTANGYASLNNTTGGNNTGIGYNSGYSNTSGSKNTFVGSYANATTGGLTNATAIGDSAFVAASNALVLGGTGANAVSVGIGLTTPLSTLDVSGSFSTAITTTSTNLTLDATMNTVILTANTLTLTLPAANTCARRVYRIVNNSGHAENSSSTYTKIGGGTATSINSGLAMTFKATEQIGMSCNKELTEENSTLLYIKKWLLFTTFIATGKKIPTE